MEVRSKLPFFCGSAGECLLPSTVNDHRSSISTQSCDLVFVHT